MPGFNPWIDVAIVAAVWVPMVGALLLHEYRKSKTQKALRGATRV
jgi:hypothetical protein